MPAASASTRQQLRQTPDQVGTVHQKTACASRIATRNEQRIYLNASDKVMGAVSRKAGSPGKHPLRGCKPEHGTPSSLLDGPTEEILAVAPPGKVGLLLTYRERTGAPKVDLRGSTEGVRIHQRRTHGLLPQSQARAPEAIDLAHEVRRRHRRHDIAGRAYPS